MRKYVYSSDIVTYKFPHKLSNILQRRRSNGLLRLDEGENPAVLTNIFKFRGMEVTKESTPKTDR